MLACVNDDGDVGWIQRELIIPRAHLSELRWLIEASDGIASWHGERAGDGSVRVTLSFSRGLQVAVDHLLEEFFETFPSG